MNLRNSSETFKTGSGEVFRNIQASGRKFVSYIKKACVPCGTPLTYTEALFIKVHFDGLWLHDKPYQERFEI